MRRFHRPKREHNGKIVKSEYIIFKIRHLYENYYEYIGVIFTLNLRVDGNEYCTKNS